MIHWQTGDGETALDRDEVRGLRFDLQTRGELDELEQANIQTALLWARRARRLAKDLLTLDGVLELHRRLFRDVWTWAGQFRTTEKNIGVAPYDIGAKLRQACDDARYWFDSGTYTPPEAALRYHHRLAFIHPFANGNGRHARITADLLLFHREHPPIRWPADRQTYLHAMREADMRRYADLLRCLDAS